MSDYVLTEARIEMTVFWDATTCSPAEIVWVEAMWCRIWGYSGVVYEHGGDTLTGSWLCLSPTLLASEYKEKCIIITVTETLNYKLVS